jgi:hypothetical protein
MAKLLSPSTVRARRLQLCLEDRSRCEFNEHWALYIKSEFRELSARCPHLAVRWYEDASGGSDSEYVCEDCGKRQHKEFGKRGM